MAASTQSIDKHWRNNENVISREVVVATGETLYEGVLGSIDGSGNAVDAATDKRIAGVSASSSQESVSSFIICSYEDLTGARNPSGWTAAAV